MTRLFATTALVGALLGAPAWAQTMNSAPTPASAAAAVQPQLSDQDKSFANDAAIAGKAEVDLGKLAQKQGKNRAVKDFGRQMVEDHGKANDQLAALAKKDGISLPQHLDQAHKSVVDGLAKLNGAAFDRAYATQAVDDHQGAVKLFEGESKSGQNADLKSFADQTLPVLRHHLTMAQAMAADLAPQAKRQGAPAESSGSSMRASHKSSAKSGDNSANQLNEAELQKLQSQQ